MQRKFKITAILLPFLIATFLISWAYYPLYRQKKREEHFQKRADQIVAKMSVRQKIGQMIHIGIPGRYLTRTVQKEISNKFVGGVILFGYNLKNKSQIMKLTRDLQALAKKSSGIPLLISTDQEGGRVHRVPENATIQFPGAMTLGQIGVPYLAREVAFMTAYDLKQIGINLILAPVLDVNNNPLNPVINTRSFGHNAELVARMGVATMHGIQDAGLIPVIKHFPGHGDTKIDSHLALPQIKKSPEEMEKVELLPFRRAIQEGAEIVMSAHILYKSLDPDFPATLSSKILVDLLRKEMGFDGLVMTDAMEMHAIAKNFDDARAANLAFKSGADIILLTGSGKELKHIFNALFRAIQSKELSVKKLDMVVRRQILLKLRRGLFFENGFGQGKNEGLKLDFEAKKIEIKNKRDKLKKKYASQSLNQVVSQAGITSLRKNFAGLKESEKIKIKLFFYSKSFKKAGLAADIKPKQMQAGGLISARRMISKRPPDETWVIEVRKRDLKRWNRFKKDIDRYVLKKKGRPTIALYSGNPFLNLKPPENGAILVSCSPTQESIKALVTRALDGKPVRKTNLISF